MEKEIVSQVSGNLHLCEADTGAGFVKLGKTV
jgi:hypothetical protein